MAPSASSAWGLGCGLGGLELLSSTAERSGHATPHHANHTTPHTPPPLSWAWTVRQARGPGTVVVSQAGWGFCILPGVQGSSGLWGDTEGNGWG